MRNGPRLYQFWFEQDWVNCAPPPHPNPFPRWGRGGQTPWVFEHVGSIDLADAGVS